MLFSKNVLYLMILCILLTSACGKSKEEREISEWVEKGALVVDVRTPKEYAGEHFPGAINIPVQNLDSRLDELGSKDREIVLYCRSGRRSAHAKSLLDAEGFTKIRDAGGIQNFFSAVSKK